MLFQLENSSTQTSQPLTTTRQSTRDQITTQRTTLFNVYVKNVSSFALLGKDLRESKKKDSFNGIKN